MNNTVWQEFIERLYNGFHNTTEVMTLIGYRTNRQNYEESIVEYVEYYTSNDEATVVGNFREIVKDMAKYAMLREKGTRFVLVHNHPAGTPEPSDSDRLMANRFQVACRMLGAVCMGSYIYIDDAPMVHIGGREEDVDTRQIRISNQYNPNGSVSLERLSVQNAVRQADNWFSSMASRRLALSEESLDWYLQRIGVEPYGLVELNEQNQILAIYEISKLMPNIQGRTTNLEAPYHKGMAMVFTRNAPRYVVYDKRDSTDTERDDQGLKEDTKKFIHAMRVSGYPVNFYSH